MQNIKYYYTDFGEPGKRVEQICPPKNMCLLKIIFYDRNFLVIFNCIYLFEETYKLLNINNTREYDIMVLN